MIQRHLLMANQWFINQGVLEAYWLAYEAKFSVNFVYWFVTKSSPCINYA